VTSPRRAASPAFRGEKVKTIDATRARQLAWIAIGVYLVGLGISATFRAQGDFNVTIAPDIACFSPCDLSS